MGRRLSLKFYDRLYLGDSIRETDVEALKREICDAPLFTKVYLITPARNGKDMLEFYESRMLTWPYYQKNMPPVLGIASDYPEAERLIMRMITECYESRGDLNLREYLNY